MLDEHNNIRIICQFIFFDFARKFNNPLNCAVGIVKFFSDTYDIFVVGYQTLMCRDYIRLLYTSRKESEIYGKDNNKSLR